MIIKLKYKNTNIEVVEGDTVKVPYNENIYTIQSVQNSDCSFDFGTAFILNNKEYTDGYKTIPVSNLIFIDRDFYDPDHF